MISLSDAIRSLVARLKADITDYKSKMGEAKSSTKAVGDEAVKTSKTAGSSFTKIARSVDQHNASLSSLARGLGGAGLALAAGVGVAINSAAKFDQSMSNVVATGTDAKKNQDALTQSAIEWGQKTQFSATEAAGGIEAMLKAGVSARDIIGKGDKGGLAGALNLAAAGGISVQSAAEDAATAMTQFRLAGKDVPHLADLLAAGAGKAQGEVGDLAQALNQSGLVASQFGLSVDETVGTLSAFASAGLLGSDAGTSFKTMLLQLANPSTKAQKLMSQLGISAYDAQGKFVGIANLAQNLHDKLHNLTQAQRDQALGQIFGNDAIRAANVLYRDGAKGIQGWISKVNDAGYAQDVARTKMDNLKGDLEQLRGAFETALIGAGEGQQGALRSIVQGVTNVVNAYNKMPDMAKSSVTRVAAELAGIGLGGAAVIKVIQGGAAIQKTFRDLGLAGGPISALRELRTATDDEGKALTSMGRAGRIAQVSLPLVGLAMVGVTTAIGYFQDQSAKAKQNADDFAQSFRDLTGDVNRSTAALDKQARATAVDQLQKSGALEAAKTLGLNLGLVTDAAIKGGPALDEVNRRIAEFDTSGQLASQSAGGFAVAQGKNADAARTLDSALNGVSTAVGKGIQSEKDRRAALAKTTAAQNAQRKATQDASVAADDAIPSLQDLSKAEDGLAKAVQGAIDKFTILNQGALSKEQALEQYQGAVTDLTKSLKTNGSTLDVHTKKGLANRSSIVAAVQAINDRVTADVKAAGPTASLSKLTQIATDKTRQYTQHLIDNSSKADGTRKKVKGMVDQMILTPGQIITQIKTPGVEQAKNNFDDISRKIHGFDNKTVKITYTITAGGSEVHFSSGGKATIYADGGYTGPGGKYEPAGIVHRGEVVFDQDAVSAAGGPRRLDGYRKALKAGTAPLPPFWAGGIVGRHINLDTRIPNAAPALDKWFKSTQDAISSATAKGVKEAIGSIGAGATPLGGGNLVHWNGGTFTENFANHLKRAYAMHPFFVFQGGWNPGGVAASGTTHDKDAVDAGPANTGVLSALRANGLAAWIRTPEEGFIYHIHGVPLPGAGTPSPQAAWQAQDYLRGGNGLWTGSSNASGWHPIAEKGAELVIEPQWKHLTSGSQVLNAQQTAALLAAGGGNGRVLEVHFHKIIDSMSAAREIKQVLRDAGWAVSGVTGG